MSITRAPRIGLVLGGGGIVGYSFHAGVLAAIDRLTGWDPRTAEVIVGTSAGSSVAAVIRGNVSVTALVERILSVPTDPEGMARLRAVAGRGQTLVDGSWFSSASLPLVGSELRRLCRARPLPLLAGIAPAGRLPTDVLKEQAEVLHPDEWPDAELWLPAVDLETGDRVVFGRDSTDCSVATAVAASCAIPAFFEPVTIRGRRYVDGGVHSMMNTDLLLGEDLDLVVALAPLSISQPALRSPMASLVRSVPRRQARRESRQLRDEGTPTLLIEPDQLVSRSMGFNPMDPTRMVPVLVGTALIATEQLNRPDWSAHLDTLRDAAQVLPSPPDIPYPDVPHPDHSPDDTE